MIISNYETHTMDLVQRVNDYFKPTLNVFFNPSNRKMGSLNYQASHFSIKLMFRLFLFQKQLFVS